MTRTVLWLLALVAVSTADTEGRKSYSRYKIVTVQASNADQVNYLNQLQLEDASLSFFQVPSLNRDIDILVPPVHVNRIKKSLKKQAMKPQVTVEDIQSLIEAESRAMRSARNSLDVWNTYLRYDQIVEWLTSAANSRSTMDKAVIGSSTEGRDIYQVKVSSDGTSKSAIWIECLSHAREWITGAVCLGIIDMLTDPLYKNDDMLEKFDWYFVPVLNPDGYEYSHTHNRYWRKNRRRNQGSRCDGVDLNRNWPARFSETGASDNPCSDVYHGPGELSEAENFVLDSAMGKTKNVTAFFSMHSYSELLLLPYAFGYYYPPDFDVLDAVAKEAMSELEKVNGTSFKVGHTAEMLYAASGGSFDHFKLNRNVKYSYCYELRPAGNQGYQGFIVPSNEIQPSIRETFASLRSFANQITDRERL